MTNIKNSTLLIIVGFLGLGLFIGSLVGQYKPAPKSLGSVIQGAEYQSTTTSALFPMAAINSWTATSSTDTTSHSGTLGTCVVTASGSAGGNINIYDATTTSVLQRALATSSILLASIPTNISAGTYVFDSIFKVGLISVRDGTQGTTTCTYRIDH